MKGEGTVGALRDRTSLVKSTLIERIVRVDLQVTDLETALRFYRDVVGLEVAQQDARRAELRSQDGPVLLHLDATADAPADPYATGLFHTAFRFPTRASLGDALARLIEADLDVGAGDHLVSEALYVEDPDGNGVELYWDRPEEGWPAPTDQMIVPMATLPVDLKSLLADGSGHSYVGATAPPGTDIGHVHLQVSDIDQTTTFYREVLGLDLVAKLGSAAGFFSSRGYHHNIGANTWRSQGSSARRPERAGLERLLFRVTEKADFETLRKQVQDLEAAETSEATTLVVKDPDGIELRFLLED